MLINTKIILRKFYFGKYLKYNKIYFMSFLGKFFIMRSLYILIYILSCQTGKKIIVLLPELEQIISIALILAEFEINPVLILSSFYQNN